jgi:polar amino acid transport system substrate-binding protein
VRRLLVLLLALAALCGLAVPASAATFQTRESGVLTVGSQLPNPPFLLGNKLSSLTGGYEYDMVREIARRLRIPEVKWVNFPFEGLVAGAPCPCDFDVNGVSIFPDRKKVVDFSAPYYTVNQGVLAKAGTATPTRAKARQLKWGASKNSSGLFYLQNTLKPSGDVRVYPTTIALSQALAAGQIDAAMTDVPIVLDLASKNRDFKVVGQFRTDEKYGAVLKKGSPNTAILSGVIRRMEAAGFFKRLEKKYFAKQVQIPVIP